MNMINSGLWDNKACAVQNVSYKQETSTAGPDSESCPSLIRVVATKDIAQGEELIALYNEEEKDLAHNSK
jgi:hypothetical protein